MNRIDATAIALRIFALWLVFKALGAAITMLEMVRVNPDPSYPVASLFLWPGAIVVLAVAIWFSPYSLARVFLPRPTQEPSGTWTREDAQLVAFAAVGVYLIGMSLASITYWGVFLYRSHSTRFEATPSMIASTVSAATQLVLGLLLVFSGRGLVRLLRLTRPMDNERG